MTSILGAGLQAGAEIYGTVTGLRTVGSLATTAWSNVSIGPLSGSRAAQLGGVKFGDATARVWGSAEAPRLVPFSANDVSASVGKNGGWGEVHVNIEGQRVQFGIIEHTADGPQFMLDKTTTLQSGEVVKLHGRGFTNIAIQKTIAAYKETFGAAPSSLPGSLALENLANFQTEFAAAQGVARDVAAAGQMAINRTSFGSARVAAGYGNFSIDMTNFGDVFIGGKTLSNVPRSVIIRAQPN